MWSDWNMGNVNIEIWDNEVFFRAPFCGRMVPLWGLDSPPTGLQTSQLLQAVLQLPTRLNNLPQIGSRPPCLEKFSWFFSGLCEDEDWRDLGWCWLQQEHCHRWIRLYLREASNLLVVHLLWHFLQIWPILKIRLELLISLSSLSNFIHSLWIFSNFFPMSFLKL